MTALSGADVRRLMQRQRQTIRSLAAAMGISQARVRYVRAYGVRGEAFVRDWLEALRKGGSR